MIAIQEKGDKQTRGLSENTLLSQELLLASERPKPRNQSTDSKSKEITKIVHQLKLRGLEAHFVKQVCATQTRTYFFTLPEDRIADIIKLDEPFARILESTLETSGISILAPVPDSALIAITVPRKTGEPVCLAPFIEVIKADQFKVPFVLGEDYTGKPRVIDLVKCQHQLIGGATGSGKSNGLKAAIASIVLTCRPDQVRLLLVDCKGMDLVVFNDVPHLAGPIITDKDEALVALDWLTQEMARRGDFLRSQGVSDIWAYNDQCTRNENELSQTPSHPFPAILVVVDEVQVLLNGNANEIEVLLRTLMQQGRAHGILLVLATQRPSADIVQGSIKANLPGRIAFHLPSKVDSRVVLDEGGAELLRGKGDLLTAQPTFSGLVRLQAPLVTEADLQKVKDIAANAQPSYLFNGSITLPVPVMACHSGKPAKSKKSLRRRFFGGGGRSDCSADLRGLTLA